MKKLDGFSIWQKRRECVNNGLDNNWKIFCQMILKLKIVQDVAHCPCTVLLDHFNPNRLELLLKRIRG